MTIPQIISLLIIILIIAVSLKKHTDLFSPAKVFSLIWAVVILLTEFKFSGYQNNWTLFSWFTLTTGLCSFLLGLYITYYLYLGKPLIPIKTIRESIQITDKFDLRKLLIIIVLLFTAYFISYIVEVISFGTLPILSPNPDQARIDFGIFGFHLFVNLEPILLFFCLEYLVLKTKRKKKKFIVISIFIISFVSYFFLLQRYNYFLFFVISIGFLYYASKIINLKKILIVAIVFISFLSVLQSIRLSKYAADFHYVISKMEYSKDYAMFTWPYMYIVMNLENLAVGVEKLDDNSYGLLTGDWLMASTGIKHWAKEYFNIDKQKYLYSAYTTSPFIWDYYYDFGLGGVFSLSLLVGIIVGLFYYKMRITGELKWIVIYSFFLFVIVISFFTNPLTSLNIIVSIFVLWFTHHFFLISQSSMDIKINQ
ncbi:MAG: O-antigen polymerase [Ignavibacteriaceae bacterium]